MDSNFWQDFLAPMQREKSLREGSIQISTECVEAEAIEQGGP